MIRPVSIDSIGRRSLITILRQRQLTNLGNFDWLHDDRFHSIFCGDVPFAARHREIEDIACTVQLVLILYLGDGPVEMAFTLTHAQSTRSKKCTSR